MTSLSPRAEPAAAGLGAVAHRRAMSARPARWAALRGERFAALPDQMHAGAGGTGAARPAVRRSAPAAQRAAAAGRGAASVDLVVDEPADAGDDRRQAGAAGATGARQGQRAGARAAAAAGDGQRIAAWANGLAADGLALAPVSALVQPPPQAPATMSRSAAAVPAAMSAPCCSTAPAWCSSPAAPTCRTPRARRAAGSCRRAASTPDEDPRAAVLRELAEEIGTGRAEIIGEHPDWLTYDLPPDLRRAWRCGGRYRGQRQRWFALRFTRRGRRHPAGPRPASGIRRLALGRAGGAAGAGGGLQAADLSRCWRRRSPVSPRREPVATLTQSLAFRSRATPWR